VSVEHHAGWYQKVSEQVRGLSNVEYLHCPIEEEPTPDEKPRVDAYVNAADQFGDGELDFALVDGLTRIRDLCAVKVIPKIRPGGVILRRQRELVPSLQIHFAQFAAR